MSSDPHHIFRQALQDALETYQPGWHIRRQASTWQNGYHKRWEENRQLGVWVDTLRRWVAGENFPRVKKFEGFLEAAGFPTEVRDKLHRLYHKARSKPSVGPADAPDAVHVVGTPPLAPGRLFVGREAVLARLQTWLHEGTGLLTIAGRSGIGKTALACQALQAEIESGDHLDGVVYLTASPDRPLLEQCYLACAKLRDENLLNEAWTSSTSIRHKLKVLFTALRGLDVVILVDGFDTMLDASGGFGPDSDLPLLLEQCTLPDAPLRLLLTSQLEPQLPANLRHQNRLLALHDGLATDAGLQLLRALDPDGTCGLQQADDETLARLVESVHGLPRALEVMAGVLHHHRLVSPQQLAARFETFADMQQVLAEGYRYLDETARQVVAALAVLRDPVPPSALVELLDINSETVLDTVQQLIRAQLVRADRESGTLHLHPLEAALAYRHLAASQRQSLLQQAILYYRHRFNPPETWQTPDDAQPHLRAFDLYIRAGRAGRAAQLLLGTAMWQQLLLWGNIQRLIAMHQQLVPALDETSVLAARNHYHQGEAYRLLGNFEAAADCFEKTIDLARLLGDTLWISRGLLGLGHLNRYWGRYEAALEAYESSLEAADAHHEEGIPQVATLGLGIVFHQLGESERALAYAEEALQLARQIGIAHMEGNALQVLGDVLHHLGAFDESLDHLQAAAVIAQSIGNHRGETHVYSLLGLLYADLGRLDEALHHHQHALAVAEKVNAIQTRAECLARLGDVLYKLGHDAEGLDALHESRQLANQIGARQTEGEACLSLLMIDLQQDRLDEAAQAAQTLLEIAGATRNRVSWQAWHTAIALYALHTGELDEAQHMIQRALAYPAVRYHHRTLVVQGLIKLQRNDLDGAYISFDKALNAAQNPDVARLYQAHNSQALASLGLAVTDNRQVVDWLQEAQAAYREARWHCNAPGVVREMQYLAGFIEPHLHRVVGRARA